MMPLPLTERELEIELMVRDGLTNKEIASRCNLSAQSVKNYIHSVIIKRGVSSRYDIMRLGAYQKQSPLYCPYCGMKVQKE